MDHEPTMSQFPDATSYWKWRAETAERDARNKQKVIEELHRTRPEARLIEALTEATMSAKMAALLHCNKDPDLAKGWEGLAAKWAKVISECEPQRGEG